MKTLHSSSEHPSHRVHKASMQAPALHQRKKTMTIQTLSTVTLETIENYRHAAALAVSAYRTGSNRLIGAVNVGLEDKLYSRTSKVAPNLTNAMIQVRGGLTNILVKGVDTVGTRTEQAIEVGSDTAVKGVTQVAQFAAGIDNRVAANGIDAVARFTLPAAQVARTVSAKVVAGADKLSTAAAGAEAKVARVVKTAKKATVRKAATVKAAVTRKAAAPKKAVASAKKTVVRTSRKVAKAV
jgi:hypothetical protein